MSSQPLKTCVSVTTGPQPSVAGTPARELGLPSGDARAPAGACTAHVPFVSINPAPAEKGTTVKPRTLGPLQITAVQLQINGPAAEPTDSPSKTHKCPGFAPGLARFPLHPAGVSAPASM